MTTNQQLNAIYTEGDALLRQGKYEEFDEKLRSFDPASMETDQIIGWLTISRLGQAGLKEYAGFFDRCKKELKERPDWEDHLLSGLQPRIAR